MTENNEIKIVYEDDDLLVVDKPSGMSTHPSRLHQGDTLADAVRAYLDMDETWTFRCINRLDKDTSGLTMIAKNLTAAQKLYKEMSEGRIQREYTALVEDDGSLPDSGTIDAPIARASDNPRDIHRRVDKSGERAITHYKVLERSRINSDINAPGTALVRFNLETGRTHQIRVHMAYIGHPIVNDPLYNPHEPHGKMQLCATKLVTPDRIYQASR